MADSFMESEFYRLIVESPGSPSILVVDYREQGRLIYANDAACRHFGRSREEMLQTSFSACFPLASSTADWIPPRQPDDTVCFDTLTAMDASVPVEVTIYPLASDGRYLACHIREIREDVPSRRARLGPKTATTLDTGDKPGCDTALSEGKLARRPGQFRSLPASGSTGRAGSAWPMNRDTSGLQDSGGQINTILENFPDTIARFDRSCHCIYINPSLRRLLSPAFSAEEEQASTEELFSFPRIPEIYTIKIRQVLATAQPDEFMLCWPLPGDGPAYFHVRLVPELDQEGGITSVLAVGRDIGAFVVQKKALEESRTLLRKLGERSEKAGEEERKRISRELHDELGQNLTALRLGLALFRQQHCDTNSASAVAIDELIGMVEATLASVREVASSLRPHALDMGLIPAIRWLLGRFAQFSGIKTEFEAHTDALPLAETRAVLVFRIVQEVLTNAARHSGASEVKIALTPGENVCLLTIRDDGRGFDPDIPTRRASLGLLGLRERALILGADFQIDSACGSGTEIRLHIPLAPGENAP